MPHRPQRISHRTTAARSASLIVGLFVVAIGGMLLLSQFQMDAALAVRAYVGGQGLRAKAQRDAMVHLEHYAVSGEEADYEAYLQSMRIPWGDRQARLELEKPRPDVEIIRRGYLQGGNHPSDIEYAIPFLLRFRNLPAISEAIEHWAHADRMLEVLHAGAEALHLEFASGRATPASLEAIKRQLRRANADLVRHDEVFSGALAEAARSVSQLCRAVMSALGVLLGAIGIALSGSLIRRMRAAELALVESEERYRGIFESVEDIVFTIRPDGTFASLSPALEPIAGWRPEEWLGRPFQPLVHPDDLPQASAIFSDTLRGRKRHGFLLRVARKSGGHLAAEFTVAPLLRDGRVVGALGVARDVSARQRLEDELRDSEEKFRSISASARDAIVMMDDTGAVTYWNPAATEIFGHARDEAMGRELHALVAPERLHAAYRQALPGFRAAGKGAAVGQTLELTALRKSGEEFPVELSLSAVRLNGKWTAIGIVRDITERKRAEAELSRAQHQLLQSEKMASIGLLAAGVAHEINNPVGYVQANLGTLQKYVGSFLELLDAYEKLEARLPPGEPMVRALRGLKDAIDVPYMRQDIMALLSESNQGIDRVKKIVADLKGFARVDESESWAAADIHQGLETTLNVIWNELKYTCDIVKAYGDLPPVECLLSQLNQVFMNLLVNAAQAIEGHGTITIRTGTRGDWIWIEIADTGAGIPAEHLKRVFDPFFTTKPVGTGTGLGLSISYGIIQKHHGHIEVDSAPGQGSRFRIWLPVRQPAGPLSQEALSAEPIAPGTA